METNCFILMKFGNENFGFEFLVWQLREVSFDVESFWLEKGLFNKLYWNFDHKILFEFFNSNSWLHLNMKFIIIKISYFLWKYILVDFSLILGYQQLDVPFVKKRKFNKNNFRFLKLYRVFLSKFESFIRSLLSQTG